MVSDCRRLNFHYRDADFRKNFVAGLSIIIPVLNKLTRLEDTLVSVLENRPPHCEIVVVLNEPYADPYQLRDEVCFVDAPSRANLVKSINVGLSVCQSPIIHVLSCGMTVSPGWTDAVLPHFNDPKVAAVAPLVLQKENQGKIVSAGVSYQSGGAAKRMAYGKSKAEGLVKNGHIFGADILAAFYRRSAWDAVGGLNPTMGGHLSGIDLALALDFAGFQCKCESECKIYVSLEDVVGGKRLAGGAAEERLFWTWAHKMGWYRAMAGHAVLIVKELMECMIRPSMLLRLGGRFWETVLSPLRSRYERKMIEPKSYGAHHIAAPHFNARKSRQSVTCSPDK
jgi:hypothetical protein